MRKREVTKGAIEAAIVALNQEPDGAPPEATYSTPEALKKMKASVRRAIKRHIPMKRIIEVLKQAGVDATPQQIDDLVATSTTRKPRTTKRPLKAESATERREPEPQVKPSTGFTPRVDREGV